MKPRLFLLVFLISRIVLPAQTTWFVKAGASPVGADASSWATATPNLEDALDAAQFGDTIWIAAGVYKPSSSGDRTASFLLKNGVRLLGGFAGTETAAGQRNWVNNPTIISGDIGTPGDSTDNSYCLFYAARTGLSTVVDGLIFERANAGHPDNVNIFAHQRGHSGSAIYLDGQGSGNFAYLTIVNCLFRHNRSDYFGAVYANGRDNGKATVRLENSRFEYNHAYFKGGGLVVENYALQPEPLLLDGTAFLHNYGRSGAGALYAEHHQAIEVNNCRFEKNHVFGGTGGAVSLFGASLIHPIRFTGCAFEGNFGSGTLDGGAVDFYSIASNTSLHFSKCSFFDNQASEGGCLNVLNSDDSRTPIRFEQCLFGRNTGNQGSVMVATLLGNLGGIRFSHCLFYENEGSELFLTGGAAATDTIRLDNSLVVKKPGSEPFENSGLHLLVRHSMTNRTVCADFGPSAVCDAGTRFNANPMWEDPENGDFHLSPCSSAINAGDNSLSTGLDTDFDGQPRIRANTVDLGPYEHDLGFEPLSITTASCPDSYDGAVAFGGSNCEPVFIAWSNGAESGTRTDSLRPGAYVFSFIDAAGHSAIDTILIPSRPGMVLTPSIVQPQCPGQGNGVAGVEVNGGTPPYSIAWENGGLGNFVFSVPAGLYPVSITDALGCRASAVIEVPDAGAIQLFYTVTPVSAPGQSDGGITVDSVWGCTGPFTWPDPPLTNLTAGTYPVTVTDPCGCAQVIPVSVGILSGSSEPGNALPPASLWPNPAAAGQRAVLAWPSTIQLDDVRIENALGQVVRQVALLPDAPQTEIFAPAHPGVYRIAYRSGARYGVVKWVVR